MSSSKWNRVVIAINGVINYSLLFKDDIKLFEVRTKENGVFTKDGVFFLLDEVQYCLDFVNKYDDPSTPEISQFGIVSFEKFGSHSMKITKYGQSVITSLCDWKRINPILPAIEHLFSANTAIDQLLDMYLISCFNHRLNVERDDPLTAYDDMIRPYCCLLYKLGLVDIDSIKTRRIDLKSLMEFIDQNPRLFPSLMILFHC